MNAPPTAFGRPLSLQTLSLCPEIQLWLLDTEVDLELACRDLDECHPPPYWAFCWGAGQALARFLLDHPEEIAGLNVVDLGAGCGVAAIAAARAGARQVTAVDLDPNALQATARNATDNGVQIELATQIPDQFDVLIAADVLYEKPLQTRLLEYSLQGHRVWVADPERAASPDLGRPPRARYTIRTQPDVDSPITQAAVFALQ